MQPESDRTVVWMDRWQMQCCGSPFALGDPVSWSLRADVDRDFLSLAASPDVAARIEYREEHHEDPAPGLAHDATGVVRSIRAVRCSYGWDEAEGASVPIAGSGLLQAVGSTSDVPAAVDGRHHLGWIVELDARFVSDA